MKIKITFDSDGAYGYPKGTIIDGKDLVNDYIETLNEVEDADTIRFLKNSEIEKSVDFVAQMWGLGYDVIPDDKVIRKCSVCGKDMIEGYVFDGTDCFCSYDCTADFFNGDRGCVEILLDEGERLMWMDSLPTAPHYKVNIGHADPNLFFYCDSWKKALDWINSKVFVTIKDEHDIEEYNKEHPFAPIEYLYFRPDEYYQNRKEYVLNVRKCDDLMRNAQCLLKSARRDKLFEEFGRAYDDANCIWDMYPEVWQGEI